MTTDPNPMQYEIYGGPLDGDNWVFAENSPPQTFAVPRGDIFHDYELRVDVQATPGESTWFYGYVGAR